MAEKKMGTQTKASMRNGRAKKSGEVYNANHNTLEKTRRGQLHIDETKFELNRYYQFNLPGKRGKVHYGGDGGFDSRKHEKRMYEHLFGAGIEARNERYIKSGHREDCLDVGDVYSNPKTAPLETILQIGNSKMIAEGIMTSEEMREKLLAAFEQTVKDLMEIGKGHVFPLSAALHCEEAVPHIHFRVAMGSTDKFGHFVANQSAALSSMGFDGRNPKTGKRDRNHNPLVAYTDKVREIFYQNCEKQGLVIDREVKSESYRQMELLAFKCEAFRKELEEAEQQKQQAQEAARTAQEALDKAVGDTNTLNSQITALTASVAALEAKNEHLTDKNTRLEERLEEVKAEGREIVAENKKLKDDNQRLKEDNDTLKKSNGDLSAEKLRLQMQIQELRNKKAAAERAAAQAKADREAAVNAAKAIEQHQKEAYRKYAKAFSPKVYETLPAQKQKRSISGKVTQEERPECVVVEKASFERISELAQYHVEVDYNRATIEALDKKIAENEIIQQQQEQLDSQETEISRLEQQIREKDLKIAQQDNTIFYQQQVLQQNGLGWMIQQFEQNQEQTQEQHQTHTQHHSR